MGNPYTEPHPHLEERAAAYTEAWRRALEWSTTYIGEAKTREGGIQKVAVFSLLRPPEDVIRKLTQTGDRPNLPLGSFIADTTASYIVDSGLIQYCPEQVQVILYSQTDKGDLFPGDEDLMGFHARRGGYAGAFVSLTDKGDGEYGLQPFILGHELGEVIVAQMLRRHSKQMGGLTNLAHSLKEGFCEALGLDYYRYLAHQQDQEFTFSYDEIREDEYRKRNLEQLLGDNPFSSLNHVDQQFLNYVAAGSIVHRLVQAYGLPKVVAYFAKEAEKVAREEEKLQESYREIKAKSGGIISISFATESSPANPPTRPDLIGLLQQLGYPTPEYFVDIHTGSRPLDARPEGAIASLLVDQFDRWFNQADENTGRSVFVASSQGLSDGPSFMGIVRSSMDEAIAEEAFGPNFSVAVFLDSWRQDILQQYT